MAQNAAPALRIVDRINETHLVMLKGNTHPLANAKNDRGRVTPDLAMTDLVLVLSRGVAQQAAFDKFVASQYEPGSPNYHHWLEPEEVGERFGPAQGDLDTISGWLRARGFAIDEMRKDHMSIRFSGTAAQVESAFHTEIHNLEVKGAQHIGNMADPQIPAALASAVVGVKALHNFFPRPLHRLGKKVRLNRETGKWERIEPDAVSPAANPLAPPPGARPLFGINDPRNCSGGTCYPLEDVAPYDFAAIYNVLPLWNGGINGSGQTIAIAGTSDISAADVATFRSSFGLPPVKSFKTIVANGKDPGQCTGSGSNGCGIGDQVENSLDVEWSGAVAPGANLVLVVAGSNSATTDTLYASESYIVQNKTAPIMNVSYGLCELAMGSAGNAEYYSLWQTAASEGIAVFVSTGDSGSPSCDQGGDSAGTPYLARYGLSVNGIASTPYNTAVGGTDLNWGSTAAPYWGATNNPTTGASALGYMPEVPWNDTCTNPLIVAAINSSLNANLSAADVCDGITTQNIYSTTGESGLLALVDTVGGSGGASGCVVNNGSSVSSCVGTVTAAGVPLVNDGYTKPAWQKGVSGIPADGVRDIPDVSFFASNGFLGSAYLICVSANGSCSYSSTTEPSGEEVGGTSVSSPAMAGVMALINQKAGAAVGNPNAQLYALAAKQTYSACSTESVKANSAGCYFNDIDTGTISMPCDWGNGSPNCMGGSNDVYAGVLTGYSATSGYDLATGLGSLNVANVVNAWPTSAAPAVSLTPGSLTFSGTLQGTASAAQAITLKNTGNAALALSGISIGGTNPGSYSQTNNCGTSVAAGKSCIVNVTFKPAAAGTLKATLSVKDNAAGSPQSVALTGTGIAPAPVVSLSAKSLTFASTTVGTAATAQKVTLTNTGTAALAFTGLGITVSGAGAASFSQTNTCGKSVAAGGNCAITVTFKPKAVGALAATVSIADNAAGSPQSVALTGTGKAPAPAVSLSAKSLTFASTTVGATAATQKVTLTNTGTAALTFTGAGITIGGTNSSSFSQTNTCGKSVAAGGNCAITVSFKPKAAGALAASLSFADNAAGSPQTVALTGTGKASVSAVSLSAKSLTFASTTLGTTAATQKVTLTNTGTAALTFTGLGITVSGASAPSFSQTNTCGKSVAAGGNCAITVIFTPKAKGPLTASISIADNAAGSPQGLGLTGTGR